MLAGRDGTRGAHGLWFSGRPSAGVRPWADLVVEDLEVIPAVVDAVGPGGSIMVAYERDETERALRRKAPPPATPLGLAMLRAGVRWFKDWYYPEGGREGGTKLQGTLPLDDERRRESERRLILELEAFLARERIRDEDRSRAEEALAVLGR
ncbi:MAG TPA: DUF1122 family protein [Actinomycetota bacterium]|nr:DUF1122 family protein [Actinomycetota bacterium]